MRKGDIVLIPFPFTNLSGTKNRPALILIVSESDITVTFITTQFKWQERFDVQLKPGLKNGLKKDSLIRLSKITTIDKDLVIGKLGELNSAELKEINTSLIRILDLI